MVASGHKQHKTAASRLWFMLIAVGGLASCGHTGGSTQTVMVTYAGGLEDAPHLARHADTFVAAGDELVALSALRDGRGSTAVRFNVRESKWSEMPAPFDGPVSSLVAVGTPDGVVALAATCTTPSTDPDEFCGATGLSLRRWSSDKLAWVDIAVPKGIDLPEAPDDTPSIGPVGYNGGRTSVIAYGTVIAIDEDGVATLDGNVGPASATVCPSVQGRLVVETQSVDLDPISVSITGSDGTRVEAPPSLANDTSVHAVSCTSNGFVVGPSQVGGKKYWKYDVDDGWTDFSLPVQSAIEAAAQEEGFTAVAVADRSSGLKPGEVRSKVFEVQSDGSSRVISEGDGAVIAMLRFGKIHAVIWSDPNGVRYEAIS